MTSIVNLFIHKIGTPYGAALALGFTMNTALFWGNVAVNMTGPMQILGAHHHRHQVGLDALSSIKIFAKFYRSAKSYFLPCVIASTLGYAGAAYLSHAAGSASLRPFLWTASAFCGFIAPWTGIALIPINNKLLALAEAKDVNESEAKAAMKHFDEWKKHHLVRVIAGGLAWVLGAIAIIIF